MPQRMWRELFGRWLKTHKSNISVVVYVWGIFGGVGDARFTRYQYHKIPMTTDALNDWWELSGRWLGTKSSKMIVAVVEVDDIFEYLW